MLLRVHAHSACRYDVLVLEKFWDVEGSPEDTYQELAANLKEKFEPVLFPDTLWLDDPVALRQEMEQHANKNSPTNPEDIPKVPLDNWTSLLSKDELVNYQEYLKQFKMEDMNPKDRPRRCCALQQDAAEGWGMSSTEDGVCCGLTCRSTTRLMVTGLERWVTSMEKAAMAGFPVHQAGSVCENYFIIDFFISPCFPSDLELFQCICFPFSRVSFPDFVPSQDFAGISGVPAVKFHASEGWHCGIGNGMIVGNCGLVICATLACLTPKQPLMDLVLQGAQTLQSQGLPAGAKYHSGWKKWILDIGGQQHKFSSKEHVLETNIWRVTEIEAISGYNCKEMKGILTTAGVKAPAKKDSLQAGLLRLRYRERTEKVCICCAHQAGLLVGLRNQENRARHSLCTPRRF